VFALTSLNPALVHDSGSCSMSAPRTVKRTRGPVCLRGRDATRLTWRNKSPADRHTPLDDWGRKGWGCVGCERLTWRSCPCGGSCGCAYRSWLVFTPAGSQAGCVSPPRLQNGRRRTAQWTDSPMDGQPNGRRSFRYDIEVPGPCRQYPLTSRRRPARVMCWSSRYWPRFAIAPGQERACTE